MSTVRKRLLRRRLRALFGPVLTVAFVATAELLRATPLRFPDPVDWLIATVAVSAYVGGFVPGFVSTGIAVAYACYVFATTPPAGFTAEELHHGFDIAVGAIGLVVMLGLLRRRAERLHRIATDAAIEAEYRTVFEEAADPLLLADATDHLVFVNRRACELSGYSREELLRMRSGELFEPESPARYAHGFRPPSSPGPRHSTVDLVRHDGTRLRVDLSVCPLSDGRTLHIVRDLSAQQATLDRLQRALSLVRATLESTTDGILVVDHDGRWVDHNRKFRDIWQIPAEIAESGDDRRALEFVVGQLADPEGFVTRVRELYATPELSSRDEIRMRDGRVLERYSIPQRIGEHTVGRVWSFRDVSDERRQAEALRETERRFIQTEKLEAVGRLAGGVAHDFNNMLTAILGEAELLLFQASLEDRPRSQVENIRSAALRSAQLTRQLLAFARRQHTAPQPMALRELIVGLEPLIRRLAGAEVEVRLDLPPDGSGPWANADGSELEQAILNLVINAGDAMPGGGSLLLRVDRDVVTEADAGRRGAPAPGSYACVSIRDTGTGIPEDVLPHLFEPFFTTKPPGRGTGLGLASVHGIVQQSHGFVEVASEVGTGSTFRILLPEHLPRDGERHIAWKIPGPDSPAHAASVLVADDEDQVRGLVVATLAGAGYDVLDAGSAEGAMEVAGARPGVIDLLLSDVLMPGTNGPALASMLLEQGRVRRVMFISGYAGGALGDDLGDLAGVAVLGKPFTSAQLLECVRRALDGEVPGPRNGDPAARQ